MKTTGLFVSSWCSSLVFLLGDPNEVDFWVDDDHHTPAFNITSNHMTFSGGINVTEAGMNAYNSIDLKDIIFEDKGRTPSMINGKLSILHVDIWGSELDNVNLTIINKNGITFGQQGTVCGVNKLTLSAKNTEGANGVINLRNMDGALFDTRRGRHVEIVVQDFSQVVPNAKGLPVNTSWITTHDIVEVDYFFDDGLRQDQFPEIHGNKVKQRGQYGLRNWGLITEESHGRKTDINLPEVNVERPVGEAVRGPIVNVARPARRAEPTPMVNTERPEEPTNTFDFGKEMSSIKSFSDAGISSYNEVNKVAVQNFDEFLNIVDLDSSCFSSELLKKMASSNSNLHL